MRTTIPNLLSVFQRLKSNSLLLIAFFSLLGASYHQNKSETKESDDLFYSKENQLIQFSEDSSYVIVLKNNKSCMNCFSVLSDYMQLLKSKSEINLIAISHSDSTTLARKRNIYESKMIFPDFKNYGVTYSKLWDESSPTPELLIIKSNMIHEFKYSEIFADGFDLVSFEVQKKIETILNTE